MAWGSLKKWHFSWDDNEKEATYEEKASWQRGSMRTDPETKQGLGNQKKACMWGRMMKRHGDRRRDSHKRQGPHHLGARGATVKCWVLSPTAPCAALMGRQVIITLHCQHNAYLSTFHLDHELQRSLWDSSGQSGHSANWMNEWMNKLHQLMLQSCKILVER